MGSITAPRPFYVPTLPQAVVEAKTLSDAQLETLIYAGDAFERDIPDLFKSVEEGLSIAPSEDGRPYHYRRGSKLRTAWQSGYDAASRSADPVGGML